MNRVKRQPAWIAAAARIAVLLSARFGLALDVDDLVIVMAAAEPLITGVLWHFVSPAVGGSDA